MIRKIEITPVLNGFIVKVGCQIVVFDDIRKMLKDLELYYIDPDEVERTYLTSALNAEHITPQDVRAEPAVDNDAAGEQFEVSVADRDEIDVAQRLRDISEWLERGRTQ